MIATALEDLMSRVAAGEVRRLSFAAPTEVAWLLPLYELALFTATWARQREIERLALSLVDQRVAAAGGFREHGL